MSHFPIHTPLSIGDLLDRVFRLYRIHASKMILGSALFLVPLGILSALLAQDATASTLLMLREAIESGEPPVQQNNGSFWAVLITPLAFVAQGFVSLVTAQLASDALHSRVLNLKESFSRARKKIFPWLGMTILMTLATMAVAFAVIIVFMICVFLFSAVIAVLSSAIPGSFGAESNVALAIGIGILLVLLYLAAIFLFMSPFVYFYARWSVALPVLLCEDQGPSSALGRSWQLTRNHVWRASFFLILSYLLAYVIVGSPTGLLQLLAGFALPTENQWIAISLISGISVIANMLISPIYSIAQVLFYYELRVRKESYDLQVQVTEIS